MKRILSLARCCATLLSAAVILAGCVHSYPSPTKKLAFTYPLDPCSPTSIDAAAAELTRPLGKLERVQANVCRTEVIAAARPAPTPVESKAVLPDPACGPVPRTAETPVSESDTDEAPRLEAQAFTQQERCLRERLESIFSVKARDGNRFGIALSGGGSKAAAFGIGVLAGLSDVELLDRADYISSVSGGSYAAYFYYAHRILPLVRSGPYPEPRDNKALFSDCVALPLPVELDGGKQWKIAEPDLVRKIKMGVPYCKLFRLQTFKPSADDNETKIPPGRYQTMLKCMQDLLKPGDCSMQPTSMSRSGVSSATIFGSLATILPSFVSNTLFDWGLATAPSAISYQDGIGLAYGATLFDTHELGPRLVTHRMRNCGAHVPDKDLVLDCEKDIFDPDPVPLTFDELRVGMLRARTESADGIPFWILNAAAPQYRSAYGWLRKGRKDTTNSDMFEMTAVSHGSGRFGYVSASPEIHDMDVLDAVRASAAFFDANQLVYTGRTARTLIGFGVHLANLDWGLDIPNYNVSPTRRTVHRLLPFPLYYLDGIVASARLQGEERREQRQSERSAFIRLIDGGNAENLGVYSLLKRGVRNILIADAAGDSKGQFGDLCGLAQRLGDLRKAQAGAARVPTHLYFPGLAEFEQHCQALDNDTPDSGYNLHGWFLDHPLLLGCIRLQTAGDAKRPCHDLEPQDVRLVVVKPALNLAAYQEEQLFPPVLPSSRPEDNKHSRVSACWLRGADAPSHLLNCDTAVFLRLNSSNLDGPCLLFPQHATWRITQNSSGTLFVAYRELARQYLVKEEKLLKGLVLGDGEGTKLFDNALDAQGRSPLKAQGRRCVSF